MAVTTDTMTPRRTKRGRRIPTPATQATQESDALPILRNKRIMIIGGTGSLGQALLAYLHKHNEIAVFSRDEEKQWKTKNLYPSELVTCILGDVRDAGSVASALRYYRPELIINAAALKQIAICEYHPLESVKTNILGVQNLVEAVTRLGHVETVIGISTDKACQPVNVYGMSKAIQERLYVEANLHAEKTRFICVRYGNVLESRGSVIPLFRQQIAKGGPVTVTLPEMTRFLLSLRQSVKLILTAYRFGYPGDVWIPKVRSASIADLAAVLIGNRDIPVKQTGIRPGEKIHEVLVSEEEVFRTIEFKNHFVIEPILPELRRKHAHQREGEALPVTFQRYSSKDFVVDRQTLRAFLKRHKVV